MISALTTSQHHYSFPGDPKRQAITSLRIRCRQLATEGGRAQVTFDLTDLDFNDFGDATEVGPKHHFTHDANAKAA